jgi:uncharacterized protein
MTEKLRTPGIFIEEVNAFPGSIVEVETAIPAFIGYTEKASRDGISLINHPIRISSIGDFLHLFGGAFKPRFTLDSVEVGKANNHEIVINGEAKAINYLKNNVYYLHSGIQLFFNNGGRTCYIVSVGTYGGEDHLVEVKKDELETGLEALLKEQEPTMVIIPDAVKLGDDCYDLYRKVLSHCANMQSRFAIFDVPEGYQERTVGDASVDIIAKFREKIGAGQLSYSAAYYPWLNTNIVQEGEITFENLDVSVDLYQILPESAAKALTSNFPVGKNAMITELIKAKPEELAAALTKDNPEDINQVLKNGKLAADFTAESILKLESNGHLKETQKLLSDFIDHTNRNYHQGLVATSPTYKNLLVEIRKVMNLLPPSSAIAGIYSMVDQTRGVWKSPANISLNSVISPSVNITSDEQEDLNVDLSGKSINAIRTFPGIGTLVWGGRTLDGNSLDWKYINIRRTMIMLEQSIKIALQSYVFEPNDANTWVTVKSMLVNYLTEKWKQGALAGTSTEDAFEVLIGLGITMTSLDILEGRMMISVKFAVVRPAEFIVISFEQQMQKS